MASQSAAEAFKSTSMSTNGQLHYGTAVLEILCSTKQQWTSKLPLQNQKRVTEGSLLAPCLYNIYTADFPETSSKWYMYADDVALTISTLTFREAELTLSHDISVVNTYMETQAFS